MRSSTIQTIWSQHLIWFLRIIALIEVMHSDASTSVFGVKNHFIGLKCDEDILGGIVQTL